MPLYIDGDFKKFIVLSLMSGVTFAESEYLPLECPGLYCGRQLLADGKFTDCGACPRGFRPSESDICMKCTDEPTFYDWLYLGFMAMLSLLLHWFFIDYTNHRKSIYCRSLLVLHLSALVESVVAALLTLILVEPQGSLEVTSCHVQMLEDWYTMLYNPSPNYTTTLHCTQEIVYPLYTVVMIYYAISLLLLMAIRPFLSVKFYKDCKGTKSIYAALYFLPILIVLQAVFGGLVYYSFPYILLVVSLVTSAAHMASGASQDFKDLLRENFCNARSLTILACHWVLHAYGIIALTELKDPSFHAPMIALIFFPVLFYILTAKFTDPDNLDKAL